jgi:hypothetical protein
MQINLHFHTTLKTISFIFITETVYTGWHELHVYRTINTNFVLLSPFQVSDRLSPPSRRGGPGSTVGPIRMRAVVDKVAVGRVFLPVLRFPLSVLFHQCSIHIFIYTLLLPYRLVGNALELSKKAMLFRTSGGIGTNSIHAPRRHVKLLSAWGPQRVR